MNTTPIAEVFGPDTLFDNSTLPAISTPLDALFSLYRQQKTDIERISGYVQGETDVIHYFMTGAQQTHGFSTINMTKLFESEPAIRALDSSYWGRAIHLTDVLEFMPAKRRNEWSEMIRTGYCQVEKKVVDRFGDAGTQKVMKPIPAFEEETVRNTLKGMLVLREQFLAERVDGLWSALSETHLTNQPQAFGKRMIISRVINSYGSVDYDTVNYIHDLRCVIAKFMGRDAPSSRLTHNALNNIARSVTRDGGSGKWHTFDGGAWKLRAYKVGTAHMEICPEMAWRLNSVLASLHPMAIPSEFRKPPSKKSKTIRLVHDLVPFEVLEEISQCDIAKDRLSLSFGFSVESLSERTEDVLRFIGGVKQGTGFRSWKFEYSLDDVLGHILRTGQLPEIRTHQYYPTPRHLAEEAVDLADIGNDDDVLEPSAGQGGIADYLPIDRTTCVEISPLQCKVLEAKGFNTVNEDFLNWVPNKRWGRVVMNPPFADGRAEAHLRKAVSLLKEDGILVAVLPASFRGKVVIDGWNHEYSTIRSGAFKGASVSVVLLKLIQAKG